MLELRCFLSLYMTFASGSMLGGEDRGRVRVSCLPCRKRKTKCDGLIPCASCKLRKIVGECEAYVPARAVPFPPAKRVRTDHARDASSPHSQAAGRLSATIDTRTEPRFETSPSSDLFGTQRDALLVEELTELLPSERDCEILLEYLVQEADFLCRCAHLDYLHASWTSFVHTGLITTEQSLYLVCALANAALLMTETSGLYYKISYSASALSTKLFAYVQQRIASDLPPAYESNDQHGQPDVARWLYRALSFGLALEYLRNAGQKKERDWPAITLPYDRFLSEHGFLDEQRPLWRAFTAEQREFARRSVWSYLIGQRWSLLFGNLYPAHHFFSGIAVQEPSYTGKSLLQPFTAGAGPSGASQIRTIFRPSKRRVIRLYRVKEQEESRLAALTSLTMIAQTQLLGPVHQQLASCRAFLSEVGPDAVSPEQESKIVHLARQALALLKQITAWRDQLPAELQLVADFDVGDLVACRQAAHASAVQTGVRIMTDLLLRSWLSVPLFAETKSVYVDTIRHEAIQSAKTSMLAVPIYWNLFTCGLVPTCGWWPAFQLFHAANTLAGEVLGHDTVHQETRRARAHYGSLVLTDRLEYTSDHMTISDNGSVSSNRGGDGTSEAREVAHHLFQCLEVLPLLGASPLGKEADQRLRSLVTRHNLAIQVETPPVSLSATPPAESLSQGGSPNYLETLLAQDDSWWDALLKGNI